MTDKQPEALRLAGLLELAPEDGVEPQTTEDAATELRRLHTENTALQQGYAAARLEIESLQARIKTMAEEHADELMVAHLDGMRAEQPAGAQQPTTQPAPQQEVQEPVAWYVTGGSRLLDEDEAKAEARHIGGTARAIPLYTAPQADSVTAPAATCPTCEAPCTTTVNMRGGEHGWGTTDLERTVYHYAPAQAADSVLEDAARLDWLLLRISGAEFRRIGVHYSGNASRADVDAARKQGENHD